MGSVKIGLEIHGYLKLDSKLFCDCAIDRKAAPNTTICPICTGQPGANPMAPNAQALEKAYAIALMLNAMIQKPLLFQRKHYSWPDLPCGYQKTMSGAYSTPTAINGDFLGIGIEELHLEEDPAKWDPITGCVDYNRSGHPLIEIVTKPEFPSAQSVDLWLRRLLTTLSYIRAIDKAAGIKCDVNVSISPGFVRTEIKNINSVSAIPLAIETEVRRQTQEPNTRQQTRTWDERLQETVFMRHKESQQDYMFIPDPDLARIIPDDALILRLKKNLPESPAKRLSRYILLGIDEVDAQVISSDIVLAHTFDEVITSVDPKTAGHWFRRDILGSIYEQNLDIETLTFNSSQLIDWFLLLKEGKISPPVAKEILAKWIPQNFDIRTYIQKHHLGAIADENLILSLCKEAIIAQAATAAEVRAGNAKALNALVGHVMARTQGKANPAQVKTMLSRLL